MPDRRPLVQLNGQMQELPLGDTVAGGVVPGRGKAGSTRLLLLPSGAPLSVTTRALTANRIYYQPWLVVSRITLAGVVAEISTGVASTEVRLGLYSADVDWQAGSLIADLGAQSSAAAAVLTYATSQALDPGRYLVALTSNGAPTLRAVRSVAAGFGLNPVLGTNTLPFQIWVSQAYGALPATGPAWTTVQYNSTGFEHFAFADVASFA